MDRLRSRFPIYSRLLRLYPVAYQRQYGEEMLQTLADMLDDPEHSKAATWLRTSFDLPLSVSKQQLIYTGAAMTHDNPNYLKRNTLLSALLLAPFSLALIVSALDHGAVMGRYRLVFSYATLVFLPAIAFLISTMTFVYWTAEQHRRTGSSFWKSLIDIRHNWFVLVVAGLGLCMALFLPFHDSTHCIMGNPVHEAAHLNRTWNCIQSSR